MVWLLLAAHIVGVAAAAVAGRRDIRAGLLVAAVAPALTTLVALVDLVSSSPARVSELSWVPALDLTFAFRTDALALMMTLLVSGIGTLVFVYAAGYFSPGAAGSSRFPASLLAFSASMLGLVWADSVWTLFIFWELTSITSFLLVGHKNADASVRTAARRALLITGGGGLVLLAGLLVLAGDIGSSLTGLTPVSGTSATVAATLILIGAATKSAQVPFHVWLPGAMAAPTPVSAYLHSATMVKAGVLLVAVLGPAFVGVATWQWLGLAFGATSILWGAIGALRHRDAKLILAWGTVSQLGLLITLLALGSGKAVFAAISLLFAHALFKAALFLVVGEIDIRTGTRDINELSGLARSMPVAFAVAAVAGASMAGVPPLLGFMAKEAAIEAVLGTTGAAGAVAAVAVIGGSILTVAYTVRFLVGVFGPFSRSTSSTTSSTTEPTEVAPMRPAMAAPAVLLGLAGLVGYAAAGTITDLVGPAAVELQADAAQYSLIRWPGLKTAFVVSMGIVASGSLLGVVLSRRTTAIPRPIGADTADATIDGVLAFAPRLTGHIQHGSLPVYLATMGATASLAALPFVFDLPTDHLVLWDHPLQGVLALAIVASAAAGVIVRSRLGAALTLGAVGIGVSALFVTHGAPDLALTQLLVETIIVVGFVLGLGHLSRRFPKKSGSWRAARLAMSLAGGLVVMVGLAAASAAPAGTAPVAELADSAVSEGGGKNVVNVILTDTRALDTLGEVVVLATVAVGILALARIRQLEAST